VHNKLKRILKKVIMT